MSKAASSRQHISAIIYDKRDRVLSVGFNSYIKTHTLQARHAKMVGEEYKVFLHAEVHAIARCKQLEQAYKIVVTRWDKQGGTMFARPCPICMSAIKEAGIKVVEHT